MKRIKKLASLLLAMVMVLSMGLTVFAANADQQPGDEPGSIEIKGSEGNGQEGTAVSVAGKTFVAYQVLTAELANGTDDKGGIVYRVPKELKTFYAGKFSLDAAAAGFDQDVTDKIAAMNAADLETFAKDVLAAAKEANVYQKRVTAEADATSVKIEGLRLGYYVIEDEGAAKPISALVLDTTKVSAEVNIKASQPVIDKKIQDGDEQVENNDAAIGDKVSYVVTSSVPDMTGYEKYYFVVNDTLSEGLTFDENSVKITILGVGFGADDTDPMAENKDLIKDTDYTVSQSTLVKDGKNFTAVEIVFKKFIQYRANAGAGIVITYDATINEKAQIGGEGNANNVKLTYSNNPQNTGKGDPDNPDKPDPKDPTGETPEETTRTFVTGIELTKTDASGAALTGAEFKIEGTKLNTVLVYADQFEIDTTNGTYWKLKDGTYTTTAPDSDTSDLYDSTTDKYSKKATVVEKTEEQPVTATGSVDGDGKLSFAGLAAGEYTITEIKAPNGYNLLKKPIVVTISFAAPEDLTKPCTWSATIEEESDNASLVSSATANSAGIITFDVKNQSGTLLPSTGGIGTTIFYVVGGILVVAAGILLVTKKRMSAR